MSDLIHLGLRFNGATGMSYYAQGYTLMALPIVAMIHGEKVVPVIYEPLDYSAPLCLGEMPETECADLWRVRWLGAGSCSQHLLFEAL
jgi:hypothetical protein